jgi:hypothetical protein
MVLTQKEAAEIISGYGIAMPQSKLSSLASVGAGPIRRDGDYYLLDVLVWIEGRLILSLEIAQQEMARISEALASVQEHYRMQHKAELKDSP